MAQRFQRTSLAPQTTQPQDRQLQTSAERRKQMADVDRSVFTQLREGIKGGFDEDRFGSRIGFGNLKRWVAPWSGWLHGLAG